MLELKWKIWVSRDGRSFFGDGRARLLEAIDQTGSLSKASKELGMSYRTAWENINSMESGFGAPLIERQIGGSQGGGSSLTDAGRRLLTAYQAFRKRLQEQGEKEFQAFLDGWDEGE